MPCMYVPPYFPLTTQPDDSHAHRRARSSASYHLWRNPETSFILSYHKSYHGYPPLTDFLPNLLYVLIPCSQVQSPGRRVHRCLSVPVLTWGDTAAPNPVKSSSPTLTSTPPPSPRNIHSSSQTHLGWSSSSAYHATMLNGCVTLRKLLFSLPCFIHL